MTQLTPMELDHIDRKKVHLDDLSLECLNHVFAYLHFEDLESLARLSYDWNQSILSSTHVFMDQFAANGPLKAILEGFDRLHVLHLKGVGGLGDSLISRLNQSPSAPHIQDLLLHGCCLSYWCHEALRLPRLQRIEFQGGFIRAPFSKLLAHCSSLSCLSISQCRALRDDDIAELCTLLPQLEYLALPQCMQLRRPRLRLPKLQTLRLVGGFGLESTAGLVDCTQLRTLDFSFCVRLSGNQLHGIVSQMSNLEDLTLVKCSGLSSLKLHSTNLRRVNLSFCTSLTQLWLDCPHLQDVMTHGCANLESVVIKESRHLHWLQLQCLLNLQHLEVIAPELRSLNLEGCRRLDQVHIEAPLLQKVSLEKARTVALRFCRPVRIIQMRQWTTANR